MHGVSECTEMERRMHKEGSDWKECVSNDAHVGR